MLHKETAQGYFELPHRADVAIKVWSGDLEGLFVQSACGLYSIMGVDKCNECNISRTIELSESDHETLLIRFLNELIFDVHLRSVIYEEMNIQVQKNRLWGELKGDKTSGFVREVKAATYHECRILKTTAGYETVIVFDI